MRPGAITLHKPLAILRLHVNLINDLHRVRAINIHAFVREARSRASITMQVLG